MTTPPAPTTGPPAAGGLAGKLKGKNGAILAAGATVVLVAVLGLARGKKDPVPAATATPTDDTTATDMWNQWQAEYESLQQQIDAQGGGTNTASGPGTPKPPVPVPVQKPPVHAPGPIVRPPAPTPKPVTKPATPPSVKVKAGDTLSGIAAKYGISMATLKKLNPTYWTNPKYRNGERIWAGDTVKLR
jgi:LysM domain